MGTLLVSSLAFAAGSEKAAAPSEALFLLQVVLLVVAGRLFGELMVRLGQPSIMGQIIGGILLGPSVLGLIFPDFQKMLFPSGEAQKSMTDAVGQLGILFLLLLAGMETDLGLARKLRKSASGVSLTGIVVPFALGFALGELLPDSLLPEPDKRLVTALFLGTALSISSVKIVASVVREMNFMRRNVGQLIVASAIIDDTVGWVIIAVTFGLAKTGTVDLFTLAKSVLGTLAFMAFSFTIGRRIVFEIIRWTNDRFRSELPVLSAIIAIMGAMAMITDAIGVHTVLGAFIAGILVGESPILTRQIDTQLRALTTALFMPVFFGLTGLQTDLTVLASPAIALLTLGVVLIASLGKFGGAFAAARFGGYTTPEALALGCGMNARGSTEVIVATIGLSVGVLNQQLFSVIVAMAIITTMAMPPTLRWALARLPLREEEKGRLEREAFEEDSFVARFERIALAVDGSASSRLAGWVAGLLASSRRMPVTVLDTVGRMETGKGQELIEDRTGVEDDSIEDLVKRHARGVAAEGDEKPAEAHVTRFDKDGEIEAALGELSDAGHDLLLAGIEPSTNGNGSFSDALLKITSSFSGTSILASARDHLPTESNGFKILIPVSGTERSIRAAEFGIAISKAAGAECAIILIEEPQQASAAPRVSDQGNYRDEVFRKIDAIADYYDLKPEKIVQKGASPELAILRQARSGRYNLIVLGVSRRTSETLSYGEVADTLANTADRSCLFVETEITASNAGKE
ncbi:potassium transporter (plasmid) [Neorhizobium sp. NCHU2750]|nr:potassium transporter [Neorhizobium sp. NCHU2750]